MQLTLNMHTTFKFPFSVVTSQRIFEFYASCPQEREMWIAGFNYVVLSSKEVQKIMNDQKIINSCNDISNIDESKSSK